MGINRWSGGMEDRKRNEKEAKAGDEVPSEEEEKRGDTSSRMESSEEPAENQEKREAAEKLRERES